MTALIAFDAAYGASVGAAPMLAAGGIACNWYPIRGYASTSMNPSQARSGGLGSIVNPEGTAGELVGMSRSGGQAFAREFMAPIQHAGVPLDGTVSVFCSVDVYLPVAQIAACDDAFLGIRDVVGGLMQVRAYGEGALISHLRSRGLAGKGWLSASRSFPGWDPNSPDVCMWQDDQQSPVASTDLNHITDVSSLGAWWPQGSPYLPHPPTPIGEDVPRHILDNVTGQHYLYDAGVLHLMSASQGPIVCDMLGISWNTPDESKQTAQVAILQSVLDTGADGKPIVAPPVDVDALARNLTPPLIAAIQAVPTADATAALQAAFAAGMTANLTIAAP